MQATTTRAYRPPLHDILFQEVIRRRKSVRDEVLFGIFKGR